MPQNHKSYSESLQHHHFTMRMLLLQLKFLPVVYAWAMPQKFQKIHNGTYLFLAQTILRKIENIQFWQASDCALQLRATPATVI